MSKTLHQFGRVLFDELEQVAVRRGGFPSLEWVKKNLEKAERDVEKLERDVKKRLKERSEPTVEPTLAAATADKCAQQARDALVLAAQTAEAVDQLRQIVSVTIRMAREVRNKLVRPPQASAGPQSLRWPVRMIRAVLDKVRQTEDHAGWDERVAGVEALLSHQEKLCADAQNGLKIDQIRKAVEAAINQVASGEQALLSGGWATALRHAVAEFAQGRSGLWFDHRREESAGGGPRQPGCEAAASRSV